MNLIAHYQEGTSDKVYLACVRELKNGKFEVIGKWGRRGGRLAEQSKGTFSTRTAAQQQARVLFADKLRKGYVDVLSIRYHGPVSAASVSQYLEKNEVETLPIDGVEDRTDTVREVRSDFARLFATKKQIQRVEMARKEGLVLVAKCLSNLGLEDSFDVGVDYVVCQDNFDATILVVFDNYGEKRNCDLARFSTVDVMQ